MKNTLVILLLASSLSLFGQTVFNGNLEKLDKNGNPEGWDLTFNNYNKFPVKLDSLIKAQGKYSLSIESGNTNEASGAISFKIPQVFKGKRATLVASIRTENVRDGFAGIWLRADGPNKQVLDFNNMESQSLKGTNDWKEYMVEIPYREETITELSLGALLVGKGKIWVDSFRLYIDYVPIDKAKQKNTPVFAVSRDTTFKDGSKIMAIEQSKNTFDKISYYAQYWSFLKYHHSTIAQGKLNWDAELIRALSRFSKNVSDSAYINILNSTLDKLGAPMICNDCDAPIDQASIFLKPDYGELLSSKFASDSIKTMLQKIIKNRNTKDNYYVGLNYSYGDPANPQFDREDLYANIKFPDVGYQLLGVIRYYGIIKYFHPNRQLIDGNLEDLLRRFLSEASLPLSKAEYVLMMSRFISKINDGHAIIDSEDFEKLKGRYRLPVKMIFTKGKKLTVTGFYDSRPDSILRPGDIITKINGLSVNSLISKFSEITPASNEQSKLNRIIGAHLLRSDSKIFKLDIKRSGKIKVISAEGILANQLAFETIDLQAKDSTYKKIGHDIIYIHAKAFKNDWRSLEQELSTKNGMIIDLRTYPESNKTYSLIDFIKKAPSPFVTYTFIRPSSPGLVSFTPALSNGIKNLAPFKGKVAVLVDSRTISQAEATVMSFQSEPNVVVIGSQSAGADGSVSKVPLPGGLTTSISGIGMFYPNKVNTQGVGIKINYEVSPSINGIKAGTDEVLEKAISLIRQVN